MFEKDKHRSQKMDVQNFQIIKDNNKPVKNVDILGMLLNKNNERKGAREQNTIDPKNNSKYHSVIADLSKNKMSFQKQIKNQSNISAGVRPNNIKGTVILQKKDSLNQNTEVQVLDEQRVFSKSYEVNQKGKENHKNSSTEFIIKRNDSARGREGKTSHIYLNKSSNTKVS